MTETVVNADAIPSELKERDQWLMWDASADTPRRPHWRGDFSVSWTNTNDWHSFEEAHTASQEEPGWGIGYVFAYTNDDYPRGLYGALDLDGCLNESGGPKDWLPSLQPFIEAGAYIERSPSGTGLHIPITGFEPPEWWNDSHLPESEHEGVEAYGSKFFTFTGDTIDISGSDVAENVDVNAWLMEAYQAINGELPTLPGANDSSGEYDGNGPGIDVYDIISRTEYPEEENRPHPFHPSGTGTNFRVDDGAETFRCWRHGVTGNAGHLLGIEQGVIQCGDWVPTGLDSDTWREIFDEARNGGYDVPTPWNTDSSEYAKTDGGTLATTATSESIEAEWALSPPYVLQLALQSEVCPLSRNDDGNFEGSLNDLRDSEKAEFTWELAGYTDDDQVLAVENGPLYAYLDGVWQNGGEQRLREIAGESLKSAYSKNVLREIEERVRRDRTFQADELGSPDRTLATESGLLHLDSRDLESLKPEHYALRKIPVEYIPDAKAPRWRRFLEESIPAEKDRLKFQEYAGYCLWHHAQPFGKALFLVGPTDSGKGTALKTIESVLGRENVASESLFELIQTRWGGARIYGKMVNIRNEITPGGLKNIQRFKELTGGGDRISAEEKGRDKFEFAVTQKFLFATNQVPDIQHADEAFYNRCLFVRFPDTVPEENQDKELGQKLEEERSGILSWMLEGLDRLMEHGQFTAERDTGEKKELCDAFGGVIDRFVHNCVEITGETSDMVVKSDLFDLANAYAESIDQDPEWSRQNSFTTKLGAEAGVGQSQTKKLTGSKEDVYTGIQVDSTALEVLDVDVRSISDDTEGDGNGQQTL